MRSLIGICLILGGGGLGLRLQLREQRRKRETLRELEGALWHMAEEIRMLRTPMPVLLRALAVSVGKETAPFFSAVADGLERGVPLGDIWKQEAAVLPLADYEKQELQNLILGGDEENLCQGILLVRERFIRCLEDLEEKSAQDLKRTAALWGSGTAFLAILLI